MTKYFNNASDELLDELLVHFNIQHSFNHSAYPASEQHYFKVLHLLNALKSKSVDGHPHMDYKTLLSHHNRHGQDVVANYSNHEQPELITAFQLQLDDIIWRCKNVKAAMQHQLETRGKVTVDTHHASGHHEQGKVSYRRVMPSPEFLHQTGERLRGTEASLKALLKDVNAAEERAINEEKIRAKL